MTETAQDLSPALDPEAVQAIVERAANFNLLAVAAGDNAVRPIMAGGSQPVGFEGELRLHRFLIDTPLPAAGAFRSANSAGEVVGELLLRWMLIPDGFAALPAREPPATSLDRSRSQRFAMQEARVSFDGGVGGFTSFGTGRTLPMELEGRPQLVLAAIGATGDGSGLFAGEVGNFVFCGELTPELGIVGHLLVRIGDATGRLHANGPLAPIRQVANPLDGSTFLTWIAGKGEGPEQENFPSLAADGQMRGFNIPVDLHRVRADCSLGGGAFRSVFERDQPLGLEIGFGRETKPRGPTSGSPSNPLQFEGVSKYFFWDDPAPLASRHRGAAIGACTANFLEGRSFLTPMPGLEGQPTLRFGFYGPFVDGSGCFAGIQGLLYGLGRSQFDPHDPGGHVISNLYVARVSDPEHRHRLASTDFAG